MLGPEEEGKISHVTEIEISERATGKKQIEDDPPVSVPLIKVFKDQLALNKPKKGKKGKKGGKKKKKKWSSLPSSPLYSTLQRQKLMFLQISIYIFIHIIKSLNIYICPSFI